MSKSMKTFLQVCLWPILVLTVTGLGASLFMMFYNIYLNHGDEVERYAAVAFVIGLVSVITFCFLESVNQIRVPQLRQARREAILKLGRRRLPPRW